MQTVIVLIHLMIVLALIGVVMLQRSEGGGLGIGSTGGFMSSRGTANVLTRATAILATAFFITSLALSILAGLSHRPTSIIQTGAPTEAPSAPGAPRRAGCAAQKRRAAAASARSSGGPCGADRPGSAAIAVTPGRILRENRRVLSEC